MYNCHTEKEFDLRKNAAREAAAKANERNKLHENQKIKTSEKLYTCIGVSVDRNCSDKQLKGLI
jgi:hypothetical protein